MADIMDIDAFVSKAAAIVGPDSLFTDNRHLEQLTDNSLATPRSLACHVRPRTSAQVKALVDLARETGVPLYPISRGHNLGYGDRSPVTDGNVLLDLSMMRAIRNYDAELGHVEIEPGVSQQDLYEFLQAQKQPLWMDTTGAGKNASIIGNTLEGGFGHTPLGNHREEFADAEVVLGTGDIIRTGIFPNLGPDVKGIFVQSNFGIVTAMRIPLMPVPEHFESFVIKAHSKDSLPDIVNVLRRMRLEGIVRSCVHIANPMRYLISSKLCPAEYANTLLDDDDAIRIMSSPLLSVGQWSAAGGFYGLRKTVKAHKSTLKRAFKGIATVQFFSRKTIDRLSAIFQTMSVVPIPFFRKVSESLDSFRSILDMMMGIPTDEAYKNILWRVSSLKDFGLIWFAPVVDAKGDKARRIVEIAAPLYRAHGFEMPLTLTLVSPSRLVGILSITFNKNNQEEKDRAHSLYKALYAAFSADGIHTYRTSIMQMADQDLMPPWKRDFHNVLKHALDPQGIIAPGRYGMK